MSRLKPLAFFVAFVMVPALLAVAAGPVAQGQMGAIFGRVVDKPGVVFPGVAVTIEGPALPVPRTVVTDREGQYEFSGLPDGTYSLDFRITGFCPVSQDAVAVVRGGRFRANERTADNASHLRCPNETGETRVRFETTLGAVDIVSGRLVRYHAPTP